MAKDMSNITYWTITDWNSPVHSKDRKGTLSIVIGEIFGFACGQDLHLVTPFRKPPGNLRHIGGRAADVRREDTCNN